MTRMITLAAGLAFAGAANAAFVGGVIRVDTAASAAATAAAGTDLTVTRLSFQFTEADDILNRVGNSSVSTANGATLFQETLFGNPVNTAAQQNSGAWGAIPTLEFDSYVGMGGPASNFGTGQDSVDPDFAFTPTGFVGGWFDIPTTDAMGNVMRQGLAGDGNLVNGLYEVFAAQLTVNGDFTGGARGGESGSDTFVFSEIFEGQLDIGWIDNINDGFETPVTEIFVGVPAPGAAALFGMAGLTAARRRR